LFDNFYGLEDVAEDEVNYWLDKMKMKEKVSYSKGAFSTTSLSTGQRKRLALIIAILDNRPVLVLDEFAADQDSKFRKYFYMEIIPELKRMNKLIIAVSHDDNYFHVADRVLSMKNGQLFPFDGEISHVY
jgi:ABC-type siderophore export system fused ATPase/permease subunit